MAFITRSKLLNNYTSKYLYRRFSRLQTSDSLIKTCLYDFHIENEAKMVEFAGYEMPLLYKSHSIIDSHNWVRTKCGLFDVSHMLQFTIHGRKRADFIHSLSVIDCMRLDANQGSLSLFTNNDGGIMDDFIINNCLECHFFVVSNAGCADKMRRHLNWWVDKFQNQGKDVRIQWLDRGLIALQGPMMTEVLQPGIDFPLKKLFFGSGVYCTVFGIENCRVSRCGYTGEDGVEISVPNKDCENLVRQLVANKSVILVGLGARDTLRLEAGMCLYGNDIDETTTPPEASLAWTIDKARRNVKDSEIKFPGYDIIMDQLNKKTPIAKRRVGLLSSEGPPPRNGTEILDKDSNVIGTVTSGCFSPFIRLNVAMGYVKTAFLAPKTEVQFRIRNKTYPGVVQQLPFVKTNFFTGIV